MATEQTFVIVGASLAGAKAAQTLREEGFTGRLVLIGDESERPYVRPPLSKGYLLGKQDQGKLYVHDEAWYAANGVELTLGRRVTRIDRAERQVEFEGGDQLEYSKLLLATGASPRRLELPGADLDGSATCAGSRIPSGCARPFPTAAGWSWWVAAGGHVTAVTTDDGNQIPADVVIVGVGVQPATELADKASGPTR